MRSTAALSFRCTTSRTAPKQEPVTVWAAQVVADPAAHHATEREAAIIADLVLQLGGAR